MIAVNVMVALQQYREHVKEAVRAGADAVICGAGLPVDLPELVEAGKAKICTDRICQGARRRCF